MSGENQTASIWGPRGAEPVCVASRSAQEGELFQFNQVWSLFRGDPIMNCRKAVWLAREGSACTATDPKLHHIHDHHTWVTLKQDTHHQHPASYRKAARKNKLIDTSTNQVLRTTRLRPSPLRDCNIPITPPCMPEPGSRWRLREFRNLSCPMNAY